jgi:hypothetical protein
MNSSLKFQYTDISKQELELSQIFQEQYNDLFHEILHIHQNQFISNLIKQVSIMIKILNKSFSETLIKKVLSIFNKIYINDKNQCINDLNTLKKLKIEKLPFLERTNYFIHCQSCKEALHSCGNSLIVYNNLIYCILCEEVYKINHIKLFCPEHNVEYYSRWRKIENKNFENLFLVSFLKKHCENSKINLIKCPFCKDNLYYDISSNKNFINKLICVSCNKIFDTSKLNYLCDICHKNFKCEAEIYIDFDNYKLKSICIIQALMNKIFSVPKIIINKECNCDFSKMRIFRHFDNGILFEGKYKDKKVIVCSECFNIFNYDNFEWICPICNKHFKTKEMRLSKSTQRSKYSFKNINALIKKRRENSGGNHISKKNSFNLLNHLYKKSLNEEISKSHLNNLEIEENPHLIKKRSEFDFKNLCSPSETRKMHNILFEFMNIKNGKNSFRNNYKSKISINNNHNIKLNINNFPESQRLNKSNKFIGKFCKNLAVKIDLSTKLEEKEIIKTEIDNSKLNTNSNGRSDGANSSTTNSESNNEKNNCISYSNTFNYKKTEFDCDDYNILQLIGEGTFGKIYSVEDPTTHLKYAMKKITASSMNELNEKKKEYELLINLLNENQSLKIVKIIGIQSKKLDKLTYVMYVLMELANLDWEKEIRERAKRNNYYKEKELIKILLNLIETFSYLQSKGISHRDIKPQNILCFNDNIYKIADFGEAKTKEKKRLELLKNGLIDNEDYNNDTNKQTVRGTELYMSPILFKAYRKSHLINTEYNAFKSDVFSLGFCFFFAATLTYQSLYDIREVYDMDTEKIIVESYLKGRYSNKFINLILMMLQIKEKKRPDFIELETWIQNNYFN